MTETCPPGESTQPTKEPDYSQGSDDPLKELRTDMTTLLTRAWIDRKSEVRGREVSSNPISLLIFETRSQVAQVGTELHL